jgi:acyl-CoA thioesterase-2
VTLPDSKPDVRTPQLSPLIELLALQQADKGVFRSSRNVINDYDSVFGGQLFAQALRAAELTAPGYAAHSAHGYFLASGRGVAPIDYHVEMVRDGRRLSSRRVSARQAGRELFSLGCSLRAQTTGFDHQIERTLQLPPDKGLDLSSIAERTGPGASPLLSKFAERHGVECRIVEEIGFVRAGGGLRRQYWLRVPGAEGADTAVQRCILAYISDMFLSGIALAPHAVPLPGPHLFTASIDHAVWFHRDVTCQDWLLFETDSPSASSGLGLSRGLVYDTGGRLVASVAQEALQQLATP